MFDSGSACSSPGRAPAPETSLFHPKPVRPSFSSSFSAPGSLLASSVSPPYATSNASSSASSSPSPPHPAAATQLKPSHSLSSKHRPGKMSKKLSSTTTNKKKNVQVALEVKVERSRGFHAFFVPLARAMPPAPPSSPVFGQAADRPAPVVNAQTWPPPHQGKQGEQTWVEDVQTMDID